jgi:hypothetical protein
MNPRPSVSLGISSQAFTCKQFKTQVSAGKLMAKIFWDAGGVMHMDFLEPGTTTNPECNIATLKTLSIYSRHGDYPSMDKCQYMIDKVCLAFLLSYFNHTSLVGTLDYTSACHLCITAHQSYQHGCTGCLLAGKNSNIILCVLRMKNLLVIC